MMSTVPVSSWRRQPAPSYDPSMSLKGPVICVLSSTQSPKRSLQHMNPLLSKPLPSLPQRCSSVFSLEIIRDTGVPEEETIRPQTAGENGRRANRRGASRAIVPPEPSPQTSRIGTVLDKRQSLPSRAFLNEEQYGVGTYMARANHYFREKKYEIFPELAPQQHNLRNVSQQDRRSRKKNLSRRIRRLGAWKGRLEYHTEGAVQGLKAIRTYMQKPRSGKNVHGRTETFYRSARFPQPYHLPQYSSFSMSRLSSTSTIDSLEIQRTLAEVNEQLQYVALKDRMDSSEDSLPLSRDDWLKPAAGLVNNQYGTANTYECPRSIPSTRPMPKILGQKPRGIRFPWHFGAKYERQCQMEAQFDDPMAPSSADSSIASRNGSSQVSFSSSRTFLSAWDGAKQLLTEPRAARRRMELKKQIRLIGPIDQYPDGTVNQWT